MGINFGMHNTKLKYDVRQCVLHTENGWENDQSVEVIEFMQLESKLFS